MAPINVASRLITRIKTKIKLSRRNESLSDVRRVSQGSSTSSYLATGWEWVGGYFMLRLSVPLDGRNYNSCSSRDNMVCIVTGLRAGRPGGLLRFTERGKGLFPVTSKPTVGPT
jgi:hypothetical protein